MNKCRLCQQIDNNLIKVYSNRIRSLAQIILKLKGFKDSLDVNQFFAICENCKYGIENVATFWENIPEAKPEKLINTEIYKDYNQAVSSNNNIGTVSEPLRSNFETRLEPIKIGIKLPRKCKKKDEPFQKRIRRRPKRYENFNVDLPIKISSNKDITAQPTTLNESSLKNFPQIAILRSANGQDLGKLFEVDDKGITSKMRISCQTCCQVFIFEKSFQKHLKAHKNNLENGKELVKIYFFYCTLCDKSFSEHYSVRRHFRFAHSEERPLICKFCKANFKYKFNLDYHMATHVPNKKRFECVFCKKMFLMRYELQIHLRTHTKEKPYKCEICSYAFAHRSNLKAHQKVKHLKSSANQTHTPNAVEKLITNGKLEDKTFKPPKILLENEIETQPDVFTLPTFKDFKSDFSSDKFNSFEIKNSLENIALPNPKLKDAFDKNNLHLSESNASRKAQLNFGNFQIDSSVLNVLPSATLLGLKKWPKSFQNTSITSSENLDPFKINKTTTYNSKDQVNPSLYNNATNNEIISQNMTDTVKTIIKYSPLKANYLGNSEKNNNTYILNSSQPDEILNSNTTNFEDSSGDCKVINISTLSNRIEHEHLRGIQNIENKSKITKINLNEQFNSCYPVKGNNSQSWKVIKVSSRPVKIKNILNLKTSKNSATTNSAVTHKPNKVCQTSSYLFKKSKNHSLALLTTSQVSEKETNIPTIRSSSLTTSKQSLLKPVLKSQELCSTSLTSLSTTKNILSDKPLITKIEILSPLKPPLILQNSSLTTTPKNLVKSPTDYNYQCPYCYKYFKQKSPLTKHIRTHTGEKPYKCNLCPKSYVDASNYKKHKILHKNAADALNISRMTYYAVQNSPAYSTVSDPDPDGIEVMQTIKNFECSSTEDGDDVDDNASLSSSTMESNMWYDALENALMNDEIRENIKRNLESISSAILPKSIHQITTKSELNLSFSTMDPD